jgi:hypothetical protein
MRHVPRPLVSCLLACAWLGAALAGAAPEPAASAPLAQSAQVRLEGALTSAGLRLRVRPTIAGAPLTVTGVSVSVAGHSALAAQQPDGSWLAPLAGSPAAGRPLDIVVLHDGIREVLSAQLPAPPRSIPGGGLMGGHGQIAWWVLNIAIVLIAVLALSRRMS